MDSKTQHGYWQSKERACNLTMLSTQRQYQKKHSHHGYQQDRPRKSYNENKPTAT